MTSSRESDLKGLQLTKRAETEVQARIKALRDAACVGLSDIEAGRLHSFAAACAMGPHLARLAEDALMPTAKSALAD
jgi:antitoxin ParD1/3/4